MEELAEFLLDDVPTTRVVDYYVTRNVYIDGDVLEVIVPVPKISRNEYMFENGDNKIKIYTRGSL